MIQQQQQFFLPSTELLRGLGALLLVAFFYLFPNLLFLLMHPKSVFSVSLRTNNRHLVIIIINIIIINNIFSITSTASFLFA
uniref:Uncharacterized protein n=1 Tax=Panagrolaimus sp. ES5 TaxID=591445 RepID=A0AC34FAL7_9BILA